MKLVKNPRSNRGYTLVEILAVVAIIMALTGIFIVAIRSSLQKGRVANVMGTSQAVSTAVTDFLQKSGSSGVIPLTEGNVGLVTVSTGALSVDASATTTRAAIIDTVLLTEGALEKPLSIRMGPTQNQTVGGTSPLLWNVNRQRFEAGSGSADYTGTTRIECGIPGTTGVPPFRVDGRTFITSAYRVVYLVIPNVAIDDAYALALSANGAPMLSSDGGPSGITSVDDAATSGVTKGPVTFAPASDGVTTVYYYITRQ